MPIDLRVRKMEPIEMVYYMPISGAKVHCFGQMAQIDMDDEVTPAVVLHRTLKLGDRKLAKGSLLILDPRVVVINPATRFVMFSPRDPENTNLPGWADAWLYEHPEWPAILELN